MRIPDSTPIRWMSGALFLAAAVAVIGFLSLTAERPAEEADEPLEILRIATTTGSFIGWSAYVAAEEGFFRKNRLAVDFRYGAYGKLNIQAVLDGEADVAISSETPFIRMVQEGADLCVLAVLITARDHLGLVARKSAGIQKPRDLSGKRVGLAPASNGEYLLDLVLTLHRLEPGAVRRIGLKPDQMVRVLLEGKVDAVAAWNPHKRRALEALGEDCRVFDAHGVYSSYFILTAVKAFVRSNPGLIRKTIRSFHDASQFIRSRPVPAMRILTQYVPAAREGHDLPAATYDVRLQLDQAFLYTLEDQSKWAADQRIAGRKRPLNFLNFICSDALTAAAPDSVTLFR